MGLKLSPTQIAFNARGDGKFNKPFTEQVDFFRQKLNLPTERFDDILKDAHDRSFVVAGAMKADLLNDLRQAVDRSIVEGKSIQWFRAEFDNIVAKNGWTGWTGEGTKAGRDWRTRVIYRTNLSTSYAAGRWQQLNDPDLLKRRPYWKYIHNDTVLNPRPLHQSWSGMVLRHDDPFWQTHFPPNGWGCRCRVTAVRESEYKDHPAPDDGTYIYKDKAGNEHVLPKGIDYGWDYAPGASLSGSIKPVVNQKLNALPKPLAEALAADVKSVNPARVFEAQATAKAAAQWAVDNDLVDFADYGKVNVAVANDMNRSLFDHLQEFPELRKNQRFVGTAQAQFSRGHHLAADAYAIRLEERGYAADEAKRLAYKYTKKHKTPANRWMQSWAHNYVSGIAVNEKWGKDLLIFKRALVENVSTAWHPVACDTVKSCVDHELGHQLDDLLGLSDGRRQIGGQLIRREIDELYTEALRAGIKGVLSEYAGKSFEEFIAEAWAEFRNNPNPRPLAVAVARIIKDEYAKKYPA
jgi:hypothetical protein